MWIFTGGFTKSGGAAGVDASHGTVFRQATEGVPGADESHDSFGGALAAGDVDGDDFPDLAIGASFETIGSASRTGNVWVLHGASGGTTTSGAVSFSGPTVGIARSGDDPMFGDTMSGS